MPTKYGRKGGGNSRSFLHATRIGIHWNWGSLHCRKFLCHIRKLFRNIFRSTKSFFGAATLHPALMAARSYQRKCSKHSAISASLCDLIRIVRANPKTTPQVQISFSGNPVYRELGESPNTLECLDFRLSHCRPTALVHSDYCRKRPA